MILKKPLKELENKDYQEIKFKNKIFRIYKWENKPFKDFPIPKGFDWCEYFDFVELINNNKIELEKYPIYYYTKNQFKINVKKGWLLSGVCLVVRSGCLNSWDENLADFDDEGRVVISK